MEKRLFLLDAYALIYRSYYAFIKNPRINSKQMNTSAIFGFVNTLEELIRKEKPTHLAVAFDPKGGTFRHEAYEHYKAQRPETPEDIRISVPIIKELLNAYRIPILEVPGFEADDVIGTLSKEAKAKGFTVYMMTPDKDYGQLVEENIYIYKPKYGSNECEVVDEAKVLEKYSLTSTRQMIDLLGLMGDASDNIPGCPGVGEVTAKKILAEYGSIEQLLEKKETLKGALQKKVTENEEMIRFSQFLATIRTDVPLEWSEEEFLLTSPNEEELGRLFDELEFRAIKKKVLPAPAPKKDPMQGSLFAFEEETLPVEEENNLFSMAGETIPTSFKQYDPAVANYRILSTREAIDAYLQTNRSSKIVVMDTETTDVDPIVARLVGMSLSFGKNEAVYIPFSGVEAEDRQTIEWIKPLLTDPTITLVGQNLKYDLIVLRKYGVKLRCSMFDTMIAHYLMQPEQPHNMDALAEVYLGYQTIHIDQLIGPKGKNQLTMDALTPEQIYVYACEDADITYQLYETFKDELPKKSLDQLFYDIEMPLMKVLVEMELNGVVVDRATLAQLSEELTEKLKKKEESIYELAGDIFNINSAKQVGEILFEKLKIDDKAKKTKTGQYTTSEEVLEKLKGRHEIVGKILDYRGLKKLLSTYIDALPELINPVTGRIHTSFNQTVAATGRLSSTKPNLQNIPIRDEEGREIRKAFVAPDEELFLSADYSQIELRIMAHLSNDSSMIEAFNSGEDIHAATAAKIYKVPLSEVTKEMRRKAKTANFGIIYGISAFGLSERLNISRTEARDLIESYFETYPGVKNYMDQCIADAKKKGYVQTLFGRRRMLLDINSANANVRGYAERNAINAPIQGTSADIIKIAMVRIQNKIEEKGLKSQMLIQVHDELNFSVPTSEKEIMEELVRVEMESAITLHVPVIADLGWGKNWFEAH